MQYQRLGTSSIQVSRIGFGCMSLHPAMPHAEKLIHQAIAGGINYFDTADLYDKGENEKLVGRALKAKRQAVVLATKAGNQWRSDGSGWDWNPRKDYILKAVEDSLVRLQTDYIDLYQLHGGTMEDPWQETMEAFEQLKTQGKILAYGISSIRPTVIRNWLEHAHPASVMMQYSLLDRRPEEFCLGHLQQHNVGVLVRGSIAQGLLIDKAPKPYLNYTAAEVAKMAKLVGALCTGQRSRAQTAIQYVLQHPAVTSVVVGMHTAAQLDEAIHSLEIPPLGREEIGMLAAALPANRYTEHR